MALTDTSRLLFDGMQSILHTWQEKHDGSNSALCWLLRAQCEEVMGADVSALLLAIEPTELRESVKALRTSTSGYWADIRYSSLEPVTMLWGTVVNAVRVAAESGRATAEQRKVFDFPIEDVLAFFRAARDRMEVADGLYHAYRAMPAPECQAMAALLNVHVDARLDSQVMCRLVRLLDHEGPMSLEETRDLTALASTHLVHATFRGLRGSA